MNLHFSEIKSIEKFQNCIHESDLELILSSHEQRAILFTYKLIVNAIIYDWVRSVSVNLYSPFARSFEDMKFNIF